MEIEGNVQKNVGKVQKGYGDLKEDIKKTTKTNTAELSPSPDRLAFARRQRDTFNNFYRK